MDLLKFQAVIEANTAALVANTAAITGTGKAVKATKGADAPAPSKAAADTPAQQAAGGPPTIKQIADQFLKWGATDRDKALAMLEHFGVSKLNELKPEKFVDVKAYMDNNGPAAPAAGASDLLG